MGTLFHMNIEYKKIIASGGCHHYYFEKGDGVPNDMSPFNNALPPKRGFHPPYPSFGSVPDLCSQSSVLARKGTKQQELLGKMF